MKVGDRMIEQVTLSGVVLHSMPIGEYDKRLVILTKERGKITAFARGARKQSSPFLAGSQPMSFGEFTVYQGRNSYTITGIKVTKYFSEELTDINKMSYAMYFLELADYYGREGVDAADMLNLIYLSMKALINPSIPDRLVRVIFELRTLVVNGEYPDVFLCGNCGAEENLNVFDKKGLRILCTNCHGHSSHYLDIDNSVLYAIQFIVTTSLTRLFTFNVKNDVLIKLEEIVSTIITKYVDKEFKSLEFLIY